MAASTSSESRRSTAAQFFMDEDIAATEAVPTHERVVELLNEASLMQKDAQKVNNLRQVQELIINKDPNLLDNFLDEMLAFHTDKSVDVKKAVISFMEEACKKDPEVLYKVLPSLSMLLAHENTNVQKKVILSLNQMYKSTIQWLSKAKTTTPEMTAVWEQMNSLKGRVIQLLDSDNDGIRTHAVKFIEGLVLVLSKRSADSEVPKKAETEVALDQIPESSRYLRVSKLEEEGQAAFTALLQFQSSPHISSINLMTVMGAMSTIARQRPVFFDQVIQAFEALHVNLPPTLAKSQVSSVRKNLKMQMMQLLRHPASVDFISQITTLLTDLGASSSEINKNLPRSEDGRKRKLEDFTSSGNSSKKVKVEVDLDVDDDDNDIGMTPWVNRQVSKPAGAQKQNAIDITAEDLVARLTPQNVADLVLISMVMLPDTMPAQFQASYTPIAAAGTDTQVGHLARLLATQITMAGLGKGLAQLQKVMEEESAETASKAQEEEESSKQSIRTVVGGYSASAVAEKKPEAKLPVALPVAPARKGIRQFKLATVTHPLDAEKLDSHTISAMKRILNGEKSALVGSLTPSRVKILSCLTAMFGGEMKDMLQAYMFEDVRGRSDLAFAWLYQEYANCQGFSHSVSEKERTSLASYDECLTRLLNQLLERPDQRDGLFCRLLLEAPVITDNAISIIRKYCQDELRITTGMTTLQDLITLRPQHRQRFLEVLLEFAGHEKHEIRNAAIRTAKKLYEIPQIQEPINTFALNQLQKLLSATPPQPDHSGRSWSGEEPSPAWTEENIKMHLFLYLGLLPINHKMIHELANVYTAASADIKRTILRIMETPVKGMGMHSPELLRLVENCPKGAETLVMRVIHILTDKTVPSPELVDRVRDLYHKRVPDVRFLIPVLTGLSKNEVKNALPKLIKLNPIVVKEVFNRLMGGHGEVTSPLSPADLLIALHNIDPAKCDMKTIIKAANLCFTEKQIYTQEVLAVVMQSLMEQNPLPTLLMRTVLQSLSMYPRLLGFVLNILQRLILKQVWRQKKVWEGFIRCCQRTKPQSFQVLLQLPPAQLKNVFEVSPDLREPLLQHVQGFTETQKGHIPQTTMRLLESDPGLELKSEPSLDSSVDPSQPPPPGVTPTPAPMPVAQSSIITLVSHNTPPPEPQPKKPPTEGKSNPAPSSSSSKPTNPQVTSVPLGVHTPSKAPAPSSSDTSVQLAISQDQEMKEEGEVDADSPEPPMKDEGESPMDTSEPAPGKEEVHVKVEKEESRETPETEAEPEPSSRSRKSRSTRSSTRRSSRNKKS